MNLAERLQALRLRAYVRSQVYIYNKNSENYTLVEVNEVSITLNEINCIVRYDTNLCEVAETQVFLSKDELKAHLLNQDIDYDNGTHELYISEYNLDRLAKLEFEDTVHVYKNGEIKSLKVREVIFTVDNRINPDIKIRLGDGSKVRLCEIYTSKEDLLDMVLDNVDNSLRKDGRG